MTVGCDIDGFCLLECAGMSTVLTVPWFNYPGEPHSLEHKRRRFERFADDALVTWR